MTPHTLGAGCVQCEGWCLQDPEKQPLPITFVPLHTYQGAAGHCGKCGAPYFYEGVGSLKPTPTCQCWNLPQTRTTIGTDTYTVTWFDNDGSPYEVQVNFLSYDKVREMTW